MGDRQVVALFHKLREGKRLELFSLITIEEKQDYGGRTYLSRTEYDVDYSRRHGYLFHQSGGGGGGLVPVSGIYFASDGIEVAESRCTLVGRKLKALNRTRRLRTFPPSFDIRDGQDVLDWLQNNASEQDTVWCSKCNDHVPGDTLCDHSWWCEKIGWYSTPSDRCGCKPGQGCPSY